MAVKTAPHMSKKHFDFIAEVLRDDVKPNVGDRVYQTIVQAFNEALAYSNEQYDERKFVEAADGDDLATTYYNI